MSAVPRRAIGGDKYCDTWVSSGPSRLLTKWNPSCQSEEALEMLAKVDAMATSPLTGKAGM